MIWSDAVHEATQRKAIMSVRRTLMDTDVLNVQEVEDAANATLPPAPLRLADRCDQCSAAAAVRVAWSRHGGAEGVLDLCGHHFRDNELGLVGLTGMRIVEDIRERLTLRTADIETDTGM